MAYCKNCINAVESNLPEGGLYCTMFRSLCGDTIGCPSGVDGKRKAKTNADRIRSMTDEELAELWWDRVDCGECPVHKECKLTGQDCKRLALDWLKQEESK